MKLQTIKKEFPFTKKIINLNNAGVCSPPAAASEYVAGFHKAYSELVASTRLLISMLEKMML